MTIGRREHVGPAVRSASPLLKVQDLMAWYGESQALHGISFEVRAGEVVSLLGRNGAGKTTTLRAISGLIGSVRGSVLFEGKEMLGRPPHHIGRAGIALCPEERAIFPSLNVLENLMLPPVVRTGGMEIEQIYALFPNLRTRSSSPGTKLSGGEQQMLAIGRILRTGAPLLQLDEPTEGLAPVIVKQIAATIETIKARGLAVLLVEQNLKFASALADRSFVVADGRIVDGFDRHQMASAMPKLQAYLGL